jgi:uncharacterized protein (DUF433 family)
MEDFDRITFNDDIMTGQACIRGSHISVSMIVGMFARGAQIEEILTEYPLLEFEDVKQALEYAAWLVQKRVYPHVN